MKKFILLLLLCAVSAFAITTSYDACYDVCKRECTQKYSAEDCVRTCSLQCREQPEPSLVDLPPAQPVITKAMTKGDIVQLPPGKPVSCRDECDWALRMCETYNYKIDCKGAFEKCAGICELQIVSSVAVPPVELTCEKRCWIGQDECAKAGVDVVSCKMKTDSCLRGCNPQPPIPPVELSCDKRCWMIQDDCKSTDAVSCKEKIDVCLRGCKPQCSPQPTCGPCPEYGCETECTKGYYQCKATGKTECSKIVVDCLDQCNPVEPIRCEDECFKIKDLCSKEGLSDAECEPKVRVCFDGCKPKIIPQPSVKVAQAEMRQPAAQQRMPEPVPAQPEKGVWSKIMSFFKG